MYKDMYVVAVCLVCLFIFFCECVNSGENERKKGRNEEQELTHTWQQGFKQMQSRLTTGLVGALHFD